MISFKLLAIECYPLGYYFYGGCEDGKTCLNGKICGTLTACRKCSLDDCRRIAASRGSFAFSYRGTSHRWCRLCDQSSFANHVSDHDWGIYTKHGNSQSTYILSSFLF